jgi:hypothetical protein
MIAVGPSLLMIVAYVANGMGMLDHKNMCWIMAFAYAARDLLKPPR